MALLVLVSSCGHSSSPLMACPPACPAPPRPPCSTELPPYIEKAGANREAEQLDVTLATVLTRMAEHRRRRTLLLAFAQHPVDFVQALVAAQVRRRAEPALPCIVNCMIAWRWGARQAVHCCSLFGQPATGCGLLR